MAINLFSKKSILVFNRERNLVYTWRKNKVFIARYPEIGIGKIGKTLTFQLFGLDKSKQTLVSELFFLMSMFIQSTIPVLTITTSASLILSILICAKGVMPLFHSIITVKTQSVFWQKPTSC
ncbi:hypothetical protein I3679_020870 [Proteus mirabilis]|uniref:Uncharacterized protein n=1 Tax=Proteus mirabilis TaxID=584 RepID=A0ABD5LXF7_PROMI